jgi:hypothetical protein
LKYSEKGNTHLAVPFRSPKGMRPVKQAGPAPGAERWGGGAAEQTEQKYSNSAFHVGVSPRVPKVKRLSSVQRLFRRNVENYISDFVASA